MCSPSRQATIKNPARQMLPILTVATPPRPQPGFVRPRPSNAEGLPHGRQRRHFLLFVKVLIKCIERSQNYKLKLQAKALVSECVKRNQMGDPHFSPLKESIELRVRALVGPIYWNQAKECMHSYHAKQSQSRMARAKRHPTAPQQPPMMANAVFPPLLQRNERVRQASALILPLQLQQRRAVASLLH